MFASPHISCIRVDRFYKSHPLDLFGNGRHSPFMISKPTSSLANGVSVIQNYVKTLPNTPGVYRMLNARNQVLYVGKAKSLKKRVVSYTRPDALPLRLQRMIAETTHMEFVNTHTEAEALLLEANLIKRLEPRYNILMKDGKSFSYIRITGDHDYPLLTKHRGPRNKSGDYFGPFASTHAVNMTLTTLHRAFLLRSCPDTVFANRSRPCLQYQIKRCSAPCVGKISQQDYMHLVKESKNFLEGKTAQIQKQLAKEMEAASQAMEYEKAAEYRDRIKALTQIQSKQNVNTTVLKDADLFAISQVEGRMCVQLFLFRNGSNFGSLASFPTHTEDRAEEDVLEAYLAQFYQDAPPPGQILINKALPNQALLEEALTQKADRLVKVHHPKSGEKAKLVNQAQLNATQALERKLAEDASQRKLLEGMASTFSLPLPPLRIEVYDNSHIQGANAVGAMIVAGPEGFVKNAYRKFNIKSTTITPGDDYGMMREVLTRRFKRALAEDKDETSTWPNLVVIDGGAGQLSAVQQVFNDLGITDVGLVAIAKGPQRNAGREDFYLPNRNPFQLKPNDPVLYYIQRLRDEAHRFAIGTHRSKRQKALGTSSLDSIPGVGAKRKKSLLQHFGSAKSVQTAGVEDLASVEGISRELAQKIYDFFYTSN